MRNFRFATVQRFYRDRPKAVQWSSKDLRDEILEIFTPKSKVFYVCFLQIRAPYLLLKTFTGCFSVRLFRFHVQRPFEACLTTCYMEFLQKSHDIYSPQRQVIFEILNRTSVKSSDYTFFCQKIWWFQKKTLPLHPQTF